MDSKTEEAFSRLDGLIKGFQDDMGRLTTSKHEKAEINREIQLIRRIRQLAEKGLAAEEAE